MRDTPIYRAMRETLYTFIPLLPFIAFHTFIANSKTYEHLTMQPQETPPTQLHTICTVTHHIDKKRPTSS